MCATREGDCIEADTRPPDARTVDGEREADWEEDSDERGNNAVCSRRSRLDRQGRFHTERDVRSSSIEVPSDGSFLKHATDLSLQGKGKVCLAANREIHSDKKRDG